MNEEKQQQHQLELQSQQEIQQQSQQEPDRPQAQARAVASIDGSKALVLLNVIVFAAMLCSPGWRTWCMIPSQELLLKFGANLGALTVNGQYWRLFTSMFVHAGLLHVGLNMYALWAFGPAVSEVFGTKRFLVIYFVSGLAGALASTVWNPAQTSAGASGALVGMAGAMLAVMVRGTAKDFKQKGFVQPLIFFAVICASLLYGFFDPDIDNAAHIGGLAGGFLSGLLLQPGQKPVNKLMQAAQFSVFALVVLAISTACLLEAKADKRSETYRIAAKANDDLKEKHFAQAFSGFDSLLKSELNAAYFIGRAEALIGLHDYDRAIADCDKAIAMSPKNPVPYIDRATARHKQGDDIEAVEDLSVVVKSYPNVSLGFNNRAWFELGLGRFKQALTDADEALRIDPSNSQALDTRGLIRFRLNQSEKALTDYERSIQLKPDEGAPYFHRAMIYDKIGHKRDAAQDRQKANELKYDPEPWELKLQSGN